VRKAAFSKEANENHSVDDSVWVDDGLAALSAMALFFRFVVVLTTLE
jgi:hypothetical protein